MAEQPGQIAERILSSAKYRWLCPQSVARVVDWAGQRWDSPARIEQGARRKLHQVYGAYLRDWDAAKARRLVDEMLQVEPDDRRGDLCRAVSALHASTRERLEILDAFYRQVLADAPDGARVLDVGCGLNAFALPWIRPIRDIRYTGWEIDRRIVDLINHAAPALGPAVRADLRGVLLDRPRERFDMVWLLKMLPCLARQDAGDLAALLDRLPAARLAVSFPLQSIGGRDKGMRRNYSRMMDGLLAGQDWSCRRTELPGELLYLIDRRQRRGDPATPTAPNGNWGAQSSARPRS